MAALAHITRTPLGTVAPATAIARVMEAGMATDGSFRPAALGMGAWNGQNRALDVRRVR